MKRILTFLIFTVVLYSCKKETVSTHSNEYLPNAISLLKDSLTAADYASLDFSKAVINKVDSVQLYFLRVPFKGKNLASDFVLVKTNRRGKIKAGKIIHLEGKVNASGDGKVKVRGFDGTVAISSLNRKAVLNSDIRRGYITALHAQPSAREQVLEAPDLPEVVVVAYVYNYGFNDFSTWLYLNSFFYLNDAGGGGGSSGIGGGYYGSIDGSGGYYYGGGGGSGSYGETDGGGAGATIDQTMLVDVDTYADKVAIDVEQYLKCFDNISDAGAQCEVGIYSDIPVDSDPNKIFDFSTGSPGHTFIQIKKTSGDGTRSVVQNIGFYPKTGWKTSLTNAPIDAKFVDDGQHEYNAGYTKSLTPDEFKSTLTEIRYLENMQYDIDNYNCTDWALAIFNKQGYGLDIPLYDIPGNLPSTGTSMPQGVYNKLLQMKQNGDVHADKIQIGFMKAWVTDSNGPCY